MSSVARFSKVRQTKRMLAQRERNAKAFVAYQKKHGTRGGSRISFDDFLAIQRANSLKARSKEAVARKQKEAVFDLYADKPNKSIKHKPLHKARPFKLRDAIPAHVRMELLRAVK